mgnify:FL=1|tara:strand:- start:831 stop:992 length:162 start_codon:yes stop_codon:yes gene_type:complete
MPNVRTPDGKTKTFSYTKEGKDAAENYQKKNAGNKITAVLANRQLKGKNYGNS